MADLGEKITKDLTIRYVAVLAVLGGLAIASFLGVARELMNAEGDTATISMAVRQRMLVDRVALEGGRLIQASSPDARRVAYDRLSESLDLLESSHAGLVSGRPEIRFSQPPSAEISSLLFGPEGHVDADLREFIAAGRALLARAGGTLSVRDPPYQALMQASSGRLEQDLERVASRYREENQRRLRELLAYHGTGLAIMLFLVLISAAGVFRPMVERIRADIGERTRAQRKLSESEERLWAILEESPVGVSVSGRHDGRIIFANNRFCEIIGARLGEIVGSFARDQYVDDPQRDRVVTILKGQGRINDAAVEFRRKDGTPFWGLLTLRTLQLSGGPVNLAWIYDITAMKEAEEKLRLTAKVVETVNEAVLITNADNRIEFVNPAFTAITEYEAEEVLGHSPAILKSGRHDDEFYDAMWTCLAKTGRWQGEIWNRRKSGAFYAEWLSLAALKDENGVTTHHVAVFSDITHRKEDEERVWRQANYDALTGLPNRALFIDRLALAVRQSRRDGRFFALLFLDLDGFKAVNDGLGHAAGDILLQQTAARLTSCMRASDTVSRLAGDEFTCILLGVQNHDDAALVAHKILDSVSRPFEIDGNRVQVQISIGIAMFPEDAEDGPTLLRLADEAMYAVKRQGKNNYLFVSGALTPSEPRVSAPCL